jgi:hypothetical protein
MGGLASILGGSIELVVVEAGGETMLRVELALRFPAGLQLA